MSPWWTGFVKRTVAPGTLILTDGWQGYASLVDLDYRHRPRTQGQRERRLAQLLQEQQGMHPDVALRMKLRRLLHADHG